MFTFFKKIFSSSKQKEQENDFSEEQYELDYESKKEGLEEVLGEMHNIVGHAIIPFAVGGAVDMYYFLNHIEGTGFATMELLNPAGNGPKPNSVGTYELVAFTKEKYIESEDNNHPFNLAERKACGFLTSIGAYSEQAILNPKDTCEVPSSNDENICLIFDLYEPSNKKFKIGNREHHLLLCMQVFRGEMEFAREKGTEHLINKLKEKGFYPYSDMDRNPVI